MANRKGGGRWNRWDTRRVATSGRLIGGHSHHDGRYLQLLKGWLHRAERRYAAGLVRAYCLGLEGPARSASRIRFLVSELSNRGM